ncbi:MAG: hypothetical protein E6J14_02475 [Chloroflexi bacterium]|nr:MAG: hypothetical protein E6J14_02475 [Chloroflexota bacterium]
MSAPVIEGRGEPPSTPDRVLESLHLSAATVKAAQPIAPLLPPLEDERLGRVTAGRVARHLIRELRSGAYQPRPALLVPVPKRSGGTRSVAVLTLDDRVVYEALVRSVAPFVERALCGPETLYGPRGVTRALRWLTFERAVLRFRPTWVVVADVANCWPTLRHELVTEVLRRAGAGPSADALGSLLGVFMATDTGLPQGLGASRVLSSAALSRVDRAMISRGWHYVRCVDDFRIAVDDTTAAARTLATLDNELAAIGLSLHPEKTRFVAGEEYERQLRSGAPWEVWMWDHLAPLLEGRADERWLKRLGAGLLRRVRAMPGGVAAATQRLREAALYENAPDGDRERNSASVASALGILLTARPRGVVECAVPLLKRYPAETPALAACLRGLSATEHWRDVVDVVEAALAEDRTLEASQRAWLFWALRPTAHTLPAGIITHVSAAASEDEWVSRLQAVWLLAGRGELGGDLRRCLEAAVPAPLRASLPTHVESPRVS